MDRSYASITQWSVLLLVLILSTACVSQADNANASANATPVPTSTPSPVSEASPTSTPAIAAESPEFDAAAWFAERNSQGETHAAIIATMEPGRTIARHEADTLINPASLVKLATSLAALRKLGPDRRFSIRVLADGVLKENGLFDGDLYFDGSDPVFTDVSAGVIVEELKSRGIRRVSGKVLVSPKFSYNFSAFPRVSAQLLAENLRLEKVPRSDVAESPKGTAIFVFNSQPLHRILLYQNTFSSNFVAHRIADEFGGADGVRRFLSDELQLPSSEVKLETSSGLGNNGMTARGIFAVIRELDKELRRHDLQPADIMPMVGEGYSTLERRLTDSEFERAIVAKTGTLSARDGGPGIASLAGIANTESGPVVFVLLSNGRDVFKHKDMQDELLRTVLPPNFEPVKLDISLPRDLLQASETRIEKTGEVGRPDQ